MKPSVTLKECGSIMEEQQLRYFIWPNFKALCVVKTLCRTLFILRPCASWKNEMGEWMEQKKGGYYKRTCWTLKTTLKHGRDITFQQQSGPKHKAKCSTIAKSTSRSESHGESVTLFENHSQQTTSNQLKDQICQEWEKNHPQTVCKAGKNLLQQT